MNYLFLGPYWLFCVVRAIMQGAFHEPNYGAYGTLGNLIDGSLGAVLWCLLALAALYALNTFSEGEQK